MNKHSRYILIIFIAVLFLFLYSGYTRSHLYAKEDKKERVFWHGLNEKEVALTFDDGPSVCTSDILDTLNETGTKAAFFVVGVNAEKYPEIVKREFEEGNIVGSHSYFHHNMDFEFSGQMDFQLDKTALAINNITHSDILFFRPPYGWEDQFVVNEAISRNYTIVEWSVSARDWESNSSKDIAANILKNVRNGSIILLHDGRMMPLNQKGNCHPTADSLPEIIAGLKERGYKIISINEMINNVRSSKTS